MNKTETKFVLAISHNNCHQRFLFSLYRTGKRKSDTTSCHALYGFCIISCGFNFHIKYYMYLLRFLTAAPAGEGSHASFPPSTTPEGWRTRTPFSRASLRSVRACVRARVLSGAYLWRLIFSLFVFVHFRYGVGHNSPSKSLV